IALLEGRPLAEAAAASEADVRRVGHCVAVLREARALQLRKVEAAREPARRAIEDRERPAAKKMLNAALAKIRQGVRGLIAYEAKRDEVAALAGAPVAFWPRAPMLQTLRTLFLEAHGLPAVQGEFAKVLRNAGFEG